MNAAVPLAPGDDVTPRHRLRPLPMGGACLVIGALALALAVGHEGTPLPSIVLAGGGVAALAGELVVRAVRVARAPEGPILLLGVLLAGASLSAVALFGISLTMILAGTMGVTGGLLIVVGGARLGALRRETPTPWAALRGVSSQERSRRMLDAASPLLAGMIVGLAALRIEPGVGFFMMVLAGTAMYAWGMRERTDTTGPPHLSHNEVAAHLHDSVLQTLALIQRNADDPARVAQLARHQERSLRDWLAGRHSGAPSTVSSALQAAAADVEQEIAGATVDVVCVGDATIDRRTQMLTMAAREAMRNAARHGSSSVRVFCETDPLGTRVFVRDTGPGLALDQVPNDRRGIRDAIIGRMEHVDGTVTIDSNEQGTEIELHLPSQAR